MSGTPLIGSFSPVFEGLIDSRQRFNSLAELNTFLNQFTGTGLVGMLTSVRTGETTPPDIYKIGHNGVRYTTTKMDGNGGDGRSWEVYDTMPTDLSDKEDGDLFFVKAERKKVPAGFVSTEELEELRKEIPDVSGLENRLTEGANISIDRTDPENPVISSSGGGTADEILWNNIKEIPENIGYFGDDIGLPVSVKGFPFVLARIVSRSLVANTWTQFNLSYVDGDASLIVNGNQLKAKGAGKWITYIGHGAFATALPTTAGTHGQVLCGFGISGATMLSLVTGGMRSFASSCAVHDLPDENIGEVWIISPNAQTGFGSHINENPLIYFGRIA